jgi:acyl-CoA thioesterase-2
MKPILEDLIRLLALERIDTNLFRGESRDIGTHRVFGGQVLGQALAAANYTTENRVVHSLHAYFLRAGDHGAPIVYEVDRQRDGRSFSSRRVVAIQHGRPILNMAASFQRPEEGLEHQTDMPATPPPEELRDITEYHRELIARVPAGRLPRPFLLERPFEFRPVEAPQFVDLEPREPRQDVWVKAVDRLPEDDDLHRNMLAYVSDYYLLLTALRPHALSVFAPNLQVASLDHALWFHRPFRVDDWLLYSMTSPNASGARGLSRGQIFRRDGVLVATVAQEGVTRLWEEDSE